MRGDHDEADQEFETWARTVWSGAVAFAARRVGAAAALDVVQEALIVAYGHWRRLDDDPAKRRNWLLRVVQGKAKDHRLSEQRRSSRDRRWAASHASGPGDPGEEIVALDLAEQLARLAGERSESDGDLVLMLWEGRTPAEIAAILDISENAASTRTSRMRKSLRTLGGKKMLEDGDG